MKNKTLIFFWVCLCCSSMAFAQEKVVFKEDFEGYDNDWELVDNKEFIVKQDQGKLFFSKATPNSVNNGCLWYKKTIFDFFADKNFAIEFEANSISSEYANHAFDFQWGRIQEVDGQRRILVYQLEFGLTRIRLGRFELYKGWKYYPWANPYSDTALSKFSLKRGEINKYEIIQKDSVLMVKINGQLVYRLPIEVLVGSEIGIQQCVKGEWEMDNLVIKQ